MNLERIHWVRIFITALLNPLDIQITGNFFCEDEILGVGNQVENNMK